MPTSNQCEGDEPCGPECFADGSKPLKPREVPYVNTREGCQHLIESTNRVMRSAWVLIQEEEHWTCTVCGANDYF
jgi:hypothetical protein